MKQLNVDLDTTIVRKQNQCSLIGRESEVYGNVDNNEDTDI